jgi:hypothetical protein
MPHLVEMQKKHADKGLVVISVSVDPPDEKELVAQANGFLRKLNPPFARLHLDEPNEMWSKKLDFNIPPCYFVFDRQGRWTRFRGSDFADEDELLKAMRPVVERLVNEK